MSRPAPLVLSRYVRADRDVSLGSDAPKPEQPASRSLGCVSRRAIAVGRSKDADNALKNLCLETHLAVTTQCLPETLKTKRRTDERQKIREAHLRRQAQPTSIPSSSSDSSDSEPPSVTLRNLYRELDDRGSRVIEYLTLDPCVFGGDLLRRRLTLVPGAAVWGQVEEMQAVQSEIAVLKKQGEELQKQCVETTTTLKSINETLKQLSSWVPQVDGSLKSIQATVDSVGARVTALEADRAGAEELRTPAVETDDLENGKSSNALRISVPANNIATRRGFPHTQVNFNLGVQSGNASELEESGYPSSRGGSYRARPPKTEFPKFDGENPKWWKKQLVDDRAVAQVVRLCPVSDSVEADAMPYEIEVLLKEHEECFATPKGLPPSRAFDHKIPLMAGAQPVNVKPYRYNPQQKDEIERQIKDMIKQASVAQAYMDNVYRLHSMPKVLISDRDKSIPSSSSDSSDSEPPSVTLRNLYRELDDRGSRVIEYLTLADAPARSRLTLGGKGISYMLILAIDYKLILLGTCLPVGNSECSSRPPGGSDDRSYALVNIAETTINYGRNHSSVAKHDVLYIWRSWMSSRRWDPITTRFPPEFKEDNVAHSYMSVMTFSCGGNAFWVNLLRGVMYCSLDTLLSASSDIGHELEFGFIRQPAELPREISVDHMFPMEISWTSSTARCTLNVCILSLEDSITIWNESSLCLGSLVEQDEFRKAGFPTDMVPMYPGLNPNEADVVYLMLGTYDPCCNRHSRSKSKGRCSVFATTAGKPLYQLRVDMRRGVLLGAARLPDNASPSVIFFDTSLLPSSVVQRESTVGRKGKRHRDDLTL
ncbi:hypothetical protein QYE76_050374 [Lolium multiflorum]|uniref:Uncharacterized protein n=1 Tax=Lolium multiflorum TaxID=4521 RepID=A0AAD8WJI4_LOLMU|nr:hypothetical protein QYE76_050374 [Lolium multiflorum]